MVDLKDLAIFPSSHAGLSKTGEPLVAAILKPLVLVLGEDVVGTAAAGSHRQSQRHMDPTHLAEMMMWVGVGPSFGNVRMMCRERPSLSYSEVWARKADA